MNDQTFNPEQFLNLTVSDAFATELANVPEGDYTAVSANVGPESFKRFAIKNGPNAGQFFYRLDLVWNIQDDDGTIREALGRTPTVRQSLRLEMGKDGTLEMGKGKNVDLGRLREAIGQNGSGQRWSMSSLSGQVAKIKVKHRLDTATGKTYVDVASVTKA